VGNRDDPTSAHIIGSGEEGLEMPPPVPLPPTWTLYVTVHCPSCEQDWHFVPTVENAFISERFRRDGYCPNPACPQFGYIYTIEMGLDGMKVKGSREK
jgi:hypothetical protein